MKKFSLLNILLIISIALTFAAAPQNQNFNFTYKWNLADTIVSGFSKDKIAVDNYLLSVEKSKYATNWDQLTRPSEVGASASDKLSVSEINDTFSLATDGDLFLWIAARSLDKVSVSISGTPLTAKYAVPDTSVVPNGTKDVSDYIDYDLTVGDNGSKITITNPGTGTPKEQPSILISEDITDGGIFGTYVGKVVISASFTDYVPYTYSGELVLTVKTV